jgi:hypothetical protein
MYGFIRYKKYLREVNFVLQCIPDLIRKPTNFYWLPSFEFGGVENIALVGEKYRYQIKYNLLNILPSSPTTFCLNALATGISVTVHIFIPAQSVRSKSICLC